MAYTTLFAAPSCAERKMQRKISERCIRYFTKIGLSPASTTTLPLLDTKNGISHVVRCVERKMQRKIAKRCIRYSTKVGLSPASTTTLPLLDAKIG